MAIKNIKLQSELILKKRERLSLSFAWGRKVLTIVLLAAFILLAAYYLWIQSGIGQKGYELKKEQDLKNALEIKSRELEKEILQFKAMETIKKNPQVRQMQSGTAINYQKKDPYAISQK